MLKIAPLLAIQVSVVSAGGRKLDLVPLAKELSQHHKIEFRIEGEPVGENPYDPDQIDLRLDLTTPSGKRLSIPAFYYQPFERDRKPRGRRPTEWLYPAGEGEWRARFAPTEPGEYRCVAVLRDRAGQAKSPPVTFTCRAAKGKGYVRVSRTDPRYLEFDDGTPFFPVGQNVAFIRDTYQTAEMFDRLARSGVNCVRVWACCEDWAMAIEARRSAWGRSWGWRPPIGAMPGRDGFHRGGLCVAFRGKANQTISPEPTRPATVKPETKYKLTGEVMTDTGAGVTLFGLGQSKVLNGLKRWRRFTHEFTTGSDQWWLPRFGFRLSADCTLYLRNLSLREAGGGPELLEEADPNRPALGVYHQADCFMLDKVVEAAEARGIYLQLVVFTRDHYMHLLHQPSSADYDRAVAYGKKLLRYFIARWGYSTHVAAWEYFNEMNPGLPTERFYSELGAFLETNDPYRHLRCTSDWHSPSKSFRHPKLDTAQLHYYMRPSEGERWKDAALAVVQMAERSKKVAPAKPILFAEFGMTDDRWGRPKDFAFDREFLHLHNGLWASALSGFAGAAFPWFWDEIHRKDMYRHYAPLARYLAGIPWTTAGLRPAQAACSEGVRVIGLQGPEHAFLWLSDPQATWWHIENDRKNPRRVENATVTLRGLRPGTYSVEWWDTWQGKPVSTAKAVAKGGVLVVRVPAFSRDLACKIGRER